MPLPISNKIDALPALQGQMGNAVHLIAIRDAEEAHATLERKWPMP
jgi:hypothetical protein